MKLSRWSGLFVLLAALSLAGGCASVSKSDSDGPTDPYDATDPTARGYDGAEGADGATPYGDGSGVDAQGADMGGAASGDPLSDPQSPLSTRVFYFDFDSSELSQSDRDALLAHGRYIAANPGVSVVVEGHADERGSREYNLALGERRAQAVERILQLQGVAKGQLQVISFGEERPVALGHDEGSWRLNRRVELLYAGN